MRERKGDRTQKGMSERWSEWGGERNREKEWDSQSEERERGGMQRGGREKERQKESKRLLQLLRLEHHLVDSWCNSIIYKKLFWVPKSIRDPINTPDWNTAQTGASVCSYLQLGSWWHRVAPSPCNQPLLQEGSQKGWDHSFIHSYSHQMPCKYIYFLQAAETFVSSQLTVGKVAVCSRVDGVAQRELDLLIAGEVKGVCRSRPHRQHVDPSDGPPEALCPHNLPQGVHHVPVAGVGLRLEALHPRLEKEKNMFPTNQLPALFTHGLDSQNRMRTWINTKNNLDAFAAKTMTFRCCRRSTQ